MGKIGSLLGLSWVAAAAFLLAALAACLRRVGWRVAWRDGAAALVATLGTLILAVLLWVLAYPPDASPWWRSLGSVALLASPWIATLALRSRSRRSIPRALLVSGVALFVVVLWLTLHLRGLRGGWSGSEVVAATLLATIAVALAACSGWWSKRARE